MIRVRREILTPEVIRQLVEGGVLAPNHSVDLMDLLFTARDVSGKLMGIQILRPMYYAHTLEIFPSPVARIVADNLVTFTEGFATHVRDSAPPGTFAPSGTIFHCLRTNDTIQTYMRNRGATSEADADIFRLELP